MLRKCVLALVLCWAAQSSYAQDDLPRPEGEAVDSTRYEATVTETGEAPAEVRVYTENRSEVRVPLSRSYRSPNLRANFLAQWMFIRQNGRIVRFWGARIVRLDPDSPLRSLGVRTGDVITRLDGITVCRDMYREGAEPWQLVQMERHFGLTEVRFIIQGTHLVRVGQINLDSYPDDPYPIAP